ncbi:MAG TPA: HAD hydrolase-like protein [Candidatus Paceibacterota bacterium]
MKKIIIFDFNRTMYDPDSKCLMRDARFVLRTLFRRGFSLYLISRAGKLRKEFIKNLGISEYFSRVIIAKEKSKKDFEQIAAPTAINRGLSFVVGDRVRKEIRIGNSLGLQTIWLRSGKFADEKPRAKSEWPTYIVSSLRDILSIVH